MATPTRWRRRKTCRAWWTSCTRRRASPSRRRRCPGPTTSLATIPKCSSRNAATISTAGWLENLRTRGPSASAEAGLSYPRIGASTMYQPPHHAEDRVEVIHALIRAHPLGLMVSNGADGPIANPLPFLLDAEVGPQGRLRAHLSKANQQWRQIAERPEEPVLVIFQGVDTYITPSWYATKRETGKVVPTWNYAIVQARGRARIIDDRDWP